MINTDRFILTNNGGQDNLISALNLNDLEESSISNSVSVSNTGSPSSRRPGSAQPSPSNHMHKDHDKKDKKHKKHKEKYKEEKSKRTEIKPVV
jgi:ribosomal protein L12E/L44/L45/RPP1/RPP2